MLDLNPGSVGLDVGCGNGKYMSVNPNVVVLASDRSSGLVNIACDKHVADRDQLSKKTKFTNLSYISYEKTIESPAENKTKFAPGTDTMISDGLTLPFPHNRFDFVISIAVIHHFSTPERRVQAVEEILARLKPNKAGEQNEKNLSKALIYVWALEQGSSRRGYHEGMNQDVLVPWVMKKNQAKKKKEPKPLQKKGRKNQSSKDEPKSSTNGNDNTQDGNEQGQDHQKPTAESDNVEDGATEVVKHRYYHLYKEGELENDVKTVGGRVLESGYSRDNWYAIITRDN